jgi:L-seryl-tRNA(Ser) seleniumtransferase
MVTLASDSQTSVLNDSRAIIESLGLTPVINAMGAPSRLGGTTLSASVRAAMDAAAQHCIPIAEMQERASAVIADVVGSEAGCVASGAAACLFLGTAACIAGLDRAAIDRLPDTTGLRDEVAVHRAHRNPYDHAVRATGARIVEFGYLGGPSGVGTHRWQLEAALTPKTAAVYYLGAVTEQVLPLSTVADIAHRHGVPVIVDGAGVGGPPSNLRRLIEQGADLIAVSGGKAIAGPAASGILAGRRDLVRSATMQQQDMFVYPDLWRVPLSSGEDEGAEPPHQGLGRAMKVGREELAGLIVALQEYAKRDHEAERRRWSEICGRIAAALLGIPGVTTTVAPPERGWADVALAFADPASARRIARSLETGRPRIFVGTMSIPHAELHISPYAVRDDEVQPLIDRLCDAIRENANSR